MDGVAHVAVEIGDSLSVSYIGYNTSRFRFSGDKIQVIRLLPNQTLLPAVTVRTCKSPRQLVYKNFVDIKKGKKTEEPEKSFLGVIWTKGTLNSAKVAVRLNPLEENATLKDFSFWLESQSGAPKSAILNPLIIGLYDVNDSAYMPGELIVSKPILYFPKREGKQTIELDTLSIRIPPKGIYVSLQYVMHESYEWKQFFWHRDSLGAKVVDTIVYRYGGLIKGVRTKDFDFLWYNALKEEWFSVGGRQIPNDDFHSSIKCEATIKVCEDLGINLAAHNKVLAAMLAERININIGSLCSRSSRREEQHSALSIIFQQ